MCAVPSVSNRSLTVVVCIPLLSVINSVKTYCTEHFAVLGLTVGAVADVEEQCESEILMEFVDNNFSEFDILLATPSGLYKHAVCSTIISTWPTLHLVNLERDKDCIQCGVARSGRMPHHCRLAGLV